MLSRVRSAAAAAREKGTLKSFETEYKVLTSDPPFLVRVLKNLSLKKASGNNTDEGRSDPTASAPKAKFNPFLPYDPSMYVQHLPPDHVLLLNKFNVVADHTLIVTEKFQEQSSLLTGCDFAAMWVCLNEIGGLCFYNAGRIAGASQRHKHLQHVGGSMTGDGVGVTPFDDTIDMGHKDGGIYAVKQLEYVHGVVGMRDVAEMASRGETKEAGAVSMQRYTELLRKVGDECGEQRSLIADNGERQPFAYNLLCTKWWMMVIPRRRECFEGMSVNSLGFVGCLLVRDVEQVERLRKVGGMSVLRHVGFSVGDD